MVRITVEGVITEDIRQEVVANGKILMNDLLSSTNDTKLDKLFIKLYSDADGRTKDVAQI